MPDVVVQDWGDSVFLAGSTALNNLVAAVPLVIGALLILAIGWLLSGVAARVVETLLRGSGLDRVFAQHGPGVYGARATTFRPSTVGGELVKWLIRIVFLVAAANVLNLPQVSDLLNRILLWIPNLIVGAVILLVAPLVARFVRGTIEVGAGQLGFTNGELLGRVAEVAIIAFAAIVAINQIGIATELVNILFIGVVAALALAFGLAFGLGGREVAGQLARDWYEASRRTAGRVAEAAEAADRSETETRPVSRQHGRPMPASARPR
jgi:hypothetical protein